MMHLLYRQDGCLLSVGVGLLSESSWARQYGCSWMLVPAQKQVVVSEGRVFFGNNGVFSTCRNLLMVARNVVLGGHLHMDGVRGFSLAPES
jgi:hypothetical protein